MAFGGFNSNQNHNPMAEINMVPLIDVMLVLLVIFIITAPLLTHAVKIDLPKASSNANHTRPENIQFAIDSAGRLYWNGEIIDRNEMERRFALSGTQTQQPEIHLRAEKTTQYQLVAEVMSAATRSGLNRIAFVSDPNPIIETR